VAPPEDGTASLTLVALIYLHPGSRDAFERFETAASRIMARYGGSIERRIRFAAAGETASAGTAGASGFAAAEIPDEIHLVRFPDAAAFARYRDDAELRALAELRTSAIRETVVWRGEEAPPFAVP
jgi:hypothetical protein